MYQKVVLVGRLGRDPELQYTDDGRAMCTFSLGVNYFSGGEKRTLWMRVLCFEKTAENVNKFLAKGRACLVDGKLSADKETGGPKVFTRKDGSAGSAFEMVANQVIFLGGDREASAPGKTEKTDEPVYSEEEDFPL